MAYVQVNWSHAFKIAAFIVAFFSSFLALSKETRPPKDTGIVFICVNATANNITAEGCAVTFQEAKSFACDNLAGDFSVEGSSVSYNGTTTTVTYSSFSCGGTVINGIRKQVSSANGESTTTTGSYSAVITFTRIPDQPQYQCPNDNPLDYEFTIQEQHGDDVVCVKPEEEPQDIEKDDNYCKSLSLDSGNNTAQSMCYSAYNGASCNVEKKTVGDLSYYVGTGSVFTGDCSTSDRPTYDGAGSGNENDSCIYSNGTNYCKANRSKHCNTINGAEICDDGCIDDGTNLFCDTSRHPDVGEDDSNYFDDYGTCSIIAASSSRGYCEDMGGDWDESTDYQETNCPAGGGTCSVPTAGLCAACIDAGGQWTPDNTATPSEEVKAQNEMIATQNKTNQKLDAIEHGQRKTAESVASTVSRGNEKVVAAIEKLGEQLENEKEEKESYTTTTQDVDKSKINKLFDEESKAALKAEIEAKKTELTNLINSTIADYQNTFKIDVPASTGYQARTLTLTQGTFDISMSRFSDFFKLLSGVIMFISSVTAGYILLRS